MIPQPIKLTFKPVPTYEVSLNGAPLGTFTKTSRWENFDKFVDGKNELIVMPEFLAEVSAVFERPFLADAIYARGDVFAKIEAAVTAAKSEERP